MPLSWQNAIVFTPPFIKLYCCSLLAILEIARDEAFAHWFLSYGRGWVCVPCPSLCPLPAWPHVTSVTNGLTRLAEFCTFENPGPFLTICSERWVSQGTPTSLCLRPQSQFWIPWWACSLLIITDISELILVFDISHKKYLSTYPACYRTRQSPFQSLFSCSNYR